MKVMICVAGMALAALFMPFSTLRAQTETASQEFSTFTSLEANNNFQLTLVVSDIYKVEWTADKQVMDYVDIYCRNKLLHIGISEDGLVYIRRNYKGGSYPVLKATVYAPSLSSISLSDNVILDATGATLQVDGFMLRADGKSVVDDLVVISEGGTVSLTAAKYGEINASVVADITEAVAEQSTRLTLVQDSRALICTASGSAVVSVSGDAERAVCNTKGTCTVGLSGSATSLECLINGGSTVDASSCELQKAKMTMNGGIAYVNPSVELIIDMKAGAELTYGKDPVVEITGVTKSSIKRYENPTEE